MSSISASPRQQRRREATADRIVAAAGALFAEHGVAATTVAAIAARADVAHQTFFNHFPAKQDVVREIARRGHAFFADAIDAAAREGRSTAERLARLFTSIHESAAAAGAMHQDLVSETFREGLAVRNEAGERAVHLALEGMVRRGRAAGDVSRDHPIEDQATLIFGAFSQLMFEWAHDPRFPIAERSARMTRLLADSLAPRQRSFRKQARTSPT